MDSDTFPTFTRFKTLKVLCEKGQLAGEDRDVAIISTNSSEYMLWQPDLTMEFLAITCPTPL